MVIIVLTQGLKKQYFEAPTDAKVRGSSPLWCAKTTREEFYRSGCFHYIKKGTRIRSEQTEVCVFAKGRKNSPVDYFAGTGATEPRVPYGVPRKS